MTKIYYFKVFYYVSWCERWCGSVAYKRYKLMDEVVIDDVNSLHVKKIILNNW
jgi:hypothetical protein